MRIGQSTDIHRLAEGRKLILGGVEIPSEDLEKLLTVGDVVNYLKDKGVDNL